jgi:hypothetical protein
METRPPATSSSSDSVSSISSQKSFIANVLSLSVGTSAIGLRPKQRLTVLDGTGKEGALLKVFWVMTINNRLLLVGTKGSEVDPEVERPAKSPRGRAQRSEPKVRLGEPKV